MKKKRSVTFHISASAKRSITCCFLSDSSHFVFPLPLIRLSPRPSHPYFLKAVTNFSSTQGDLGGQRTLQKKWTSFLKAKLVCSMPELNFVFNVVHDVFILKGEDWRDTVIYGVFTSQWSVLLASFIISIALQMTGKVENQSLFPPGSHSAGATWACRRCAPTT